MKTILEIDLKDVFEACRYKMRDKGIDIPADATADLVTHAEQGNDLIGIRFTWTTDNMNRYPNPK